MNTINDERAQNGQFHAALSRTDGGRTAVMAKEKTPHIPPDRSLEDHYLAQGYKVVCGTDEAGRGPLAGPVAAAAMILPPDFHADGLDDSKKLTEKARDRLYDFITENAVSWAVELVDAATIDEINILEASQLAMRRAVARLTPKADLVLVDGNIARDFPIDAVPIIGGDAKSVSIAAASIIAKVTRDRICLELDGLYPEYGFKKHKGYPTKAHREAVMQYGPSPCHRHSFLKFYYNNNNGR